MWVRIHSYRGYGLERIEGRSELIEFIRIRHWIEKEWKFFKLMSNSFGLVLDLSVFIRVNGGFIRIGSTD